MTTCTIPECDRKTHARGLCFKHYCRWRRTRDPETAQQGGRPMTPLAEALAARTRPGPTPEGRPELGPCLDWTGRPSKGGYGRLSQGKGKLILAHRAALIAAGVELPDDVPVNHKCHRRICVRVSHLEPSSALGNAWDLSGPDRDGTTGYRGVYLDKRRGTYTARAMKNGVKYYNGTNHPTAEAANEAAIELRKRLAS